MSDIECRKIAIFCPIGVVTGGPEALHQLCDTLRKFGMNARLVSTSETTTPSREYQIYDAPISDISFAQHADIIITPESHLHLDANLLNYPLEKIFVWWLSVDNCPRKIANNYEIRKNPIKFLEWVGITESLKIKLKKIKWLVRNQYKTSNLSEKNDYSTKLKIEFNEVSHISQSVYAQDFLKKELSINAILVSDYIRREILVQEKITLHNERKTVTYNFAKSHLLLKKLIKKMSKDIDFVPLTNMTGNEIRNQLERSDLYLDVGHFPGRDRMPREAILSGCPVLLARRGAVRYRGDFELDEKFKFDLVNRNFRELESVVKQLVVNKSETLKAQRNFEISVKENKENFEKEVLHFLRTISNLNENKENSE
jgi:hypothetical protein